MSLDNLIQKDLFNLEQKKSEETKSDHVDKTIKKIIELADEDIHNPFSGAIVTGGVVQAVSMSRDPFADALTEMSNRPDEAIVNDDIYFNENIGVTIDESDY